MLINGESGRWKSENDLHLIKKVVIMGGAKDVVLITEMLKFSDIASRNWIERLEVTASNTTDPQVALMNELHWEQKQK